MMKVALLLLLTVFLSPLAAEDWTTIDGKTYKDVKVLSHDAAYVTILDEDGGGRILLSTLKPDLQKRFGYDPAKAAAAIAATAAADKRDKEALAREQSISQARAAQGQDALNAAVAEASLPPPPETSSAPYVYPGPGAVSGGASVNDDTANEGPGYGQSEIDDYDYGYYGGYGGYGAYGYGLGGYGYGGYGGYRHRNLGTHYGTTGSAGRTSGNTTVYQGGAVRTGSPAATPAGGAASAHR